MCLEVNKEIDKNFMKLKTQGLHPLDFFHKEAKEFKTLRAYSPGELAIP